MLRRNVNHFTPFLTKQYYLRCTADGSSEGCQSEGHAPNFLNFKNKLHLNV